MKDITKEAASLGESEFAQATVGARQDKEGTEEVNAKQAIPVGNEKFEPIWQRVRELLKIELGAQRFQYWVDPLRVVSAEDGRVVIACNSRFERDKVVESHGE